MARKSNQQLQEEAVENLDAQQLTQFEQEKVSSQIINAQQVIAQQSAVYEMIGQMRAFAFTKKLMSIAELKILAEIKEKKAYIGMQADSGQEGFLEIRTWEEFCQKKLGYSREKVDGDLRNLRLFGEEFMEHSQQLGLGFRDLKKLGQLPDDIREEIIDGVAVETKDKGELIDLIEEMSIKHAAEREHLKKKAATLQQDIAAKDKVLKAKGEALQQREADIAKLEVQLERKGSADEVTEQQQGDINKFTTDIVNRLYELEMVVYEVKKRADAPAHLHTLTADSVNRLIERLQEIRNRYDINGAEDLIVETDEEFLASIGVEHGA